MNKKLFPIFVLFVYLCTVSVFSTSMNFTQYMEDSFENGSFNVSVFGNPPQYCTGCIHSINFLNDSTFAREGNIFVRYNITSTDALVSGGYRAELWSGNSVYGQDFWYGFSYYLPSDWVADPNTSWLNLAQWHTTPDDGEIGSSPPIALRISNNSWLLRRYESKVSCYTPIMNSSEVEYDDIYNGTNIFSDGSVGNWTDWVFNIKFSCGSDGYIKAWKNGVQVLDYTGVTAYNDSLGPYFKTGVYRSTNVVLDRYYYADSYRFGNSSSSYDLVSPASYSNTRGCSQYNSVVNCDVDFCYFGVYKCSDASAINANIIVCTGSCI